MADLQQLPAGRQTFADLRENNWVYVDKTGFFVDLLKSAGVYFFSRPRRFGKSLTISTLGAMLEGKKELFRGLAAENFMENMKPCPVIYLDMSAVATDKGLPEVESSLKFLTAQIADKYEVHLPENVPLSNCFGALIAKISEKFACQVAILIDEYDAPYTGFFSAPETAAGVRGLLRSYYAQLKASDKYLRFVFLTGISKFTKMGVFSTLNNLIDISTDERYGTMCGYTEAELLRYFTPHLAAVAEKQGLTLRELVTEVAAYYDGFCFDGSHRLYNPFSTLCFLQKREFEDFWFATGNPAFLAQYMKDKKLTVEQFRMMQVARDFTTSSVEIEKAAPESYLLQTGYLTLRPGLTSDFSLDYPNVEVLNAMSRLLSANILGENTTRFTNNVYRQFTNKNAAGLVKIFNVLLAHIPYDDFAPTARIQTEDNDLPMTPREWLYRSTLLAFLHGAGLRVEGEVHSNKGRSDIVARYRDVVVVLELKVARDGENPQTLAAAALRQINEKNYAASYPDAWRLALVIDDARRQIAAFLAA